MFLGFLLSVVMFANITKQIQGVLLGSVVVVIVGVIDDIVPLRAWIKLIAQVIAALIAVMHGVKIEILSNPNFLSGEMYISLGFLSVPVTVIWIVAITNSVNLIDGLDGLAVGVSAISSATMLVIALLVAEGNVAIILAALAGACIGFMPYNTNPAKIFAGIRSPAFGLCAGHHVHSGTVQILRHNILCGALPGACAAAFRHDICLFRRLLKGRNPMSPDRGMSTTD